MSRLFQMGFFLVSILLIVSCSNADTEPSDLEPMPLSNSEVDMVENASINESISLSNQKCYSSFEEFAYVLPDTYSSEPLLPTKPWEIESTIPSEFVGDYLISEIGFNVMFARIVDGNPEIWLARPWKDSSKDTVILTYRPITKEWQAISDTVASTSVFVSKVFMTNDGSIWGVNDWLGNITNPTKGSVLSKFNEQTQQFEFAAGVLEIPFTYDQLGINIDFVVDNKSGRIWIFVQNDGIYVYDPVSQITNKQADLENIFVNDPVLSTDGNFYFIDQHYSKMVSGNPPFRISEEMIFQFNPDIGEVIPLQTPEEPWPMTWGMFLTSSSHLWLSAVGFIDLDDGSWHLVHPEPSRFFDNVGQDAWASPDPILESSNGLLWFNKYSGLYEGTAWYDPETGKGCMFTNIPANIIEDSQQQLWLFANGKLYRYELE